MANRSNNNSNKSASKNTSTKNNRPKPMTPKAGFTSTRRRYESGGKTN